MSLNSTLQKSGEVLRMPGEFLILTRANCDFDIQIDNFKNLHGHGNAFFL